MGVKASIIVEIRIGHRDSSMDWGRLPMSYVHSQEIARKQVYDKKEQERRGGEKKGRAASGSHR